MEPTGDVPFKIVEANGLVKSVTVKSKNLADALDDISDVINDDTDTSITFTGTDLIEASSSIFNEDIYYYISPLHAPG